MDFGWLWCIMEKAMAPHSHGRRSLMGCSPWGHWGSDTTQRLHFHFSLSCIGEGNGNPLQCSCLENPRDRGAWWASIYGVAQSRTRLKRLSSSSSMVHQCRLILGLKKKMWVMLIMGEDMQAGDRRKIGAGDRRKISIPSSQFCCKPKTAIKFFKSLWKIK